MLLFRKNMPPFAVGVSSLEFTVFSRSRAQECGMSINGKV